MIYIIIPVYNRKKFTRQCLLSLRQQIYKDFKVVVIDDGSTDGTGEMLKNDFPEVHIIRGDGNLWWTGATNLGVKYALGKSNDNDFILTLNNDLFVENDYLINIIAASKKKTNSLIGSISVDAEDKLKVLDAGVRINWITAKNNNLAEQLKDISYLEQLNEFQIVDALPGRGTLIPINIFRKIGIYNEKLLPHYGADYEFAIRAKNNGFNLFVYKYAVVYSFVRATGLNNSVRKLTWKDLYKSFFSIKSPNNFIYRWHFAKLCIPKRVKLIYFISDSIRVVLGSLRNQLGYIK